MPDTATEKPVVARGLAGVYALESALSFIDGEAGILVYRGYNIHELAGKASFEEVAHLLWKGHLPNQTELDTLNAELRANREVDDVIVDTLAKLPKNIEPMAALRTAVSLLGNFDPEAEDMSPEANYRKSIRLTAQMPTVLAAFDRVRKGLPVIKPRKEGSIAAEFLYMINGEVPGAATEHTLDTCLVLQADHGSNASTFTGRAAASTLSDLHSSVVSAIGALKGPLHGGANIAVMRMLKDIEARGMTVEAFVAEKFAKKEKIMGFGHRVYKTLDPRAVSLREMLIKVSEEKGEMKWYEMETKMQQLVKDAKGLNANVDFYSAPLYYLMGIEIDLFTPIFAMSRITGWTASIMEQYADNALMRPKSVYTGVTDLKFTPISDRG
ncbi:MAG TPA: citrate synthase [Rhodothermales bacterium]|nr:citrate synthase [Rhodothermales bacterium]HRR09093.1 citrate synthase [Rhodothermales bacterium]